MSSAQFALPGFSSAFPRFAGQSHSPGFCLLRAAWRRHAAVSISLPGAVVAPFGRWVLRSRLAPRFVWSVRARAAGVRLGLGLGGGLC